MGEVGALDAGEAPLTTTLPSPALDCWEGGVDIRCPSTAPPPLMAIFLRPFVVMLSTQPRRPNKHWFLGLHDARQTIDVFRSHYNETRPYSSVDYQPTGVFARKAA